MPAPQAAMLKNMARAMFKAHAIQLPVNWQQPSGKAGEQYVDAFKPSERAVPPDPSALFIPASPNKYHVDTANSISNKFGTFIDGVCDAVAQAWGQFHSMAMLTGIVINGPVAAGGTLVGPPLTPLIIASAPKATANEIKYSKTIATVIGTAFTQWQNAVKVPGLPWYPAFALFPSPMAPPMPNIPTPLVAIGAAGMSSMMDSALSGQMTSQLGDPQAQHHKELFDSIAKAVFSTFTLWHTTTMVNNVLGMGPVPTFAPPFVPAGPVLCGNNIPVPGILG